MIPYTVQRSASTSSNSSSSSASSNTTVTALAPIPPADPAVVESVCKAALSRAAAATNLPHSAVVVTADQSERHSRENSVGVERDLDIVQALRWLKDHER